MLLQEFELIPKIPATSPTLHVSLNESFLTLSGERDVSLNQRELIKLDKEFGVKTIIMFLGLEVRRIIIFRDYVDV